MRRQPTTQGGRPVALALAGLCALAAAMGIGRFVYTPILPPMVHSLGLTSSQAGLIASANYLGYLAGALLAARPNLPGSQRLWVVASLLVSAITTAIMGLVSTLAPFLVIRFAGGAASAFVLVFSSAMVLENLARSARGGLSALHFAGVGAGIALSACLVAGVRGAGGGWRVMWLASGAVCLAGVPIVAWLLPQAEPSPARPIAAPTSSPAGGRGGLGFLIAAYGLFGFGYVITATFLVAIVRGAPATRAIEPLVWLLVGLTAVPSVLAWNRIAGSIGVFRAFGVACLVEAAGVAASVVSASAAGIVLAAVLLGGTFVGITALGLAGARMIGAGDPRRKLALMTAAFGCGQIIGPTFAGIVRDRTGSFLLPSLAASAALLMAAALGLRAGR